ncbi:hypothetical protein D3C75_644400 [compost metagenome]
MDKEEIIRDYEKHGISIVDCGGETYRVTFDFSYSPIIEKNLRLYGLEFFLQSAWNNAVMRMLITNLVAAPKGRLLNTNPFTFEIEAPFVVVLFFIQRIIAE